MGTRTSRRACGQERAGSCWHTRLGTSVSSRRRTREVVFVHPDDLAELGLQDGGYVDIVSEFEGVERRASGFRLVSYPTARGCVAAYYPETNVLMSADDLAKGSNTPV